MRKLALGLSLALSGLGLGLVVAGPGTAAACAMYRPMVVESAERLVADAAKAEKRGEPRTAIRLYERAMNDAHAAKTLRAEAAVKAGALQAKAGKARESQRRFEKAIALDATHVGAQLGLGRALALKGDVEGAQRAFAAATASPKATFAERGNAQAALSALLARQGRATQAEAALQAARLLGADPESVGEANAAARPEPFPAVAAQM